MYALVIIFPFNYRGQFSIIVKAIDFTSGKQVVAKLMETNAVTEPTIDREFDILRTLRHERIAGLIEAFKYELEIANGYPPQFRS
jgi:serine/threonine protein kinase